MARALQSPWALNWNRNGNGENPMKSHWLLIPAALAFTSCKTAQQSSAPKSLDNFTGADSVVNVCEGQNASLAPEGAIVAADAERVAAVTQALTAIPEALQREFFGTLQGKIVVGEVPAGCRLAGAPSAQALDSEMLACFKQEGDGASVAIHVAEAGPDTVRNIRHALVRTFGYVTADLLLSFPATKDEAAAPAAHLTQLRADLLALVQADLRNMGRGDLAGGMTEEVRDNLFAETFDSHYCSAETRARLNEQFPLTAARFDEMFASQLDEALTADAAPQQQGYGLWGRWGFGNGPLRQAFSNWLDFRASGGGLFNFRRWEDGGGFVFQRPWFRPWDWQIWNQGYGQGYGYDQSYGQGYSQGYGYEQPVYYYYP